MFTTRKKANHCRTSGPVFVFADLPADGACPICFASKDQFKKEE
jgi:rubrerythrin